MDIPGYEVVQEVLRTGPFAVLRGRRTSDGHPVLLKTPTRAPARAIEVEALDRELQLLHDLRLTGTPRALELIKQDGTACLVLDDHGLDLLSDRLRAGPLELPVFFRVAVQLCALLGALHHQEIIVGALAFDTTLVGKDDRELQILDGG
jgi:serine/threonine protein kinase